MAKLHNALQAEAKVWLEGKKQGPQTRDHFVIFGDDVHLWTLLVKPLDGRVQITTGLTRGEANRLRQSLSDAGFVGKVL